MTGRRSVVVAVLLIGLAAGSFALGADPASLSGSWEAEFTYDIQSASVTALDTKFTAVYRLGLFTAQGIAFLKFDAGALVFDTLELTGSFPIGRIEIDSSLMFDPNATTLVDLFDYWRTVSAFDLLGVSFTHTLYLTLPQTASYQAIEARGMVAGVDFTGSVRFDMEQDCSFSDGRRG